MELFSAIVMRLVTTSRDLTYAYAKMDFMEMAKIALVTKKYAYLIL